MAGLPPIKKRIFLLLVTLLLVAGLGAQPVKAENESSDPQITIYVVPAITDEKILPTTSISDDYVSGEIFISACPGEYEPASFVIRAHEDIASLKAEPTELKGESGSIPSTSIDIRVVKCWYQAGTSYWDLNHKTLVPELLLKDDSLVKVDGGENYLKITNGEFRWISEVQSGSDDYQNLAIADLPVKDSDTLDPVNIPQGTNKQFWITLRVPDDAPPGTYTSSIELTNASGLIGEIQLELEVLSIELLKPYLTYSFYYFGRIESEWIEGSISARAKSEEQLRAELKNMLEHGITNPICLQYDKKGNGLMGTYLTIRNEAGLDRQIIYSYFPSYAHDGWPDPNYSNWVNLYKSYGFTEFYFYGAHDEPRPEDLENVREHTDIVHAAGGKVFLALSKCFLSEEQIASLADVMDLAIVSRQPSPSLASMYHSYGHKILSYFSDVTLADEYPESHRRNHGLLLWQNDYDGSMDFAYQYNYGDIWNDFDHASERDFAMAYPTINGVIDTIQWEGWREGVDDIRYLTTLLELIEEAKESGSKDTSSAESWLADLKNSDLETKDLDEVRSEMIGHILYLLEEEPPIITSIAASGITSYSATVTWTTNEPSTSEVQYGPTEDLGLSTDLDTALVTDHSVILTDLDADTTYHYRVKTKDAAGNLATSGTYTFTTEAAPINHPPLLDPIGNKAIDEGKLLEFTISASDPDGDSLAYSAGNLPEGASFVGQTFSWTPTYTQAGTYPGVHFEVSDGNLSDAEDITITVNNVDVMPPVITFLPPTDEDKAVVNRNWAEINASVDSMEDTSSFINWNRSLLGYWNFNENSGSVANDRSTYSNNGVLINDPQWTTGKFGSALQFDGDNDFVNCGNDPSLDITDEITIEVWINPATAQEVCWDGETGNYGVAGKAEEGIPGTVWSWQLRYGSPDNCRLGFQFNGDPEGSRWVTVKQNLTPGEWYHILGTFDGTDIKSYLNGALKDTNQISGIKSSNAKLFIAEEGWHNYFNGLIDEVRIWNRALSEEEIKASYNTNLHSLSRKFAGLADGTYQYYAYATDISGNSAQTETRTLTIDTVLPAIANTSNSDITADSATITWITDEPATSQVEYGTTEDLELSTDLDTALVTNHSVILTDLTSSTTYHYKVKSRDAAGNLATSGTYTFTTEAGPAPPSTNTMWVDSITFTPTGSELRIKVKVVNSEPVRRARVRLDLKKDGRRVLYSFGITNSAGEATYRWRRATDGEYLATLTYLRHSQYTWDKSKGVTSASYTVGST